MSFVHSFAPVSDPSAKVLILGSMPGKASLLADQYYAHPRNAFWLIMGHLVGASLDLPYEARLVRLKASGIALWDVLKSCYRESSLDSDIDESTIVPNDFERFFSTHTQITQIFFNGGKAEASFRRYVQPILGHTMIRTQRLPSTSPAHASISLEQKLQAWSAVTT